MPQPQSVLDFWFKDIDSKLWFSSNETFDAEVRKKFEKHAIEIVSDASQEKPHFWESDADKALALLLVLDQFPRNMYRGTALAFQWDLLAQGVARRMLDKVWDFRIPQKRRAFVYMPFMHAEDLDMQNQCVALCESRLEDESTLFHAKAHRDVIAKFGRFPHRNEILGRESTTAELKYLESGGYTP